MTAFLFIIRVKTGYTLLLYFWKKEFYGKFRLPSRMNHV